MPALVSDIIAGVISGGGGIVRVGNHIIKLGLHALCDIFIALALEDLAQSMSDEGALEIRIAVMKVPERVASA